MKKTFILAPAYQILYDSLSDTDKPIFLFAISQYHDALPESLGSFSATLGTWKDTLDDAELGLKLSEASPSLKAKIAGMLIADTPSANPVN